MTESSRLAKTCAWGFQAGFNQASERLFFLALLNNASMATTILQSSLVVKNHPVSFNGQTPCEATMDSL
jgi:hypothetical protein